MDNIVGMLVRLMAWVAKFAPHTRITAAQADEAHPLRILLVGYNGARNTGSDVRVASLIDQIDEALADIPHTQTLMTLDASSTACYAEGKATQYPFTTTFFISLLKACSNHDVIVLCEGSMLKSKFANALTMFMCQAAGIAKNQNKPCVAYGGEIGEMEPFLERIARKMCKQVLFIPRSKGSLEALRAIGLDGIAGTDTAWRFDSTQAESRAREMLLDAGWDGEQPLSGAATINPFCWPVRPSLRKWARAALGGDHRWQYEKWYFFSWSDERQRLYDAYLNHLAQAVKERCSATGAFPVIIAMEKLDAEPCEKLRELIETPAALISSAKQDGFVIDQVISMLDELVTSRYHASLLAMKAGVPSIAVSMDERLENLFDETKLPEQLLLNVADKSLAKHIANAFDLIDRERDHLQALIAREREEGLASCLKMEKAFVRFLHEA